MSTISIKTARKPVVKGQTISTFIFTPETEGLPDSAFKGIDGEPEDAILRSRIRMSRQQNKLLNKKNKHKKEPLDKDLQMAAPKHVLINMQGHIDYRIRSIPEAIDLICTEVDGASMAAKDMGRRVPMVRYNWDLLTTYEYSPLLWQLGVEEKGGGYTEGAGNSFDEIPEWVCNVCESVQVKANEELIQWDSLSVGRRNLLAEVLFALGHIIGFEALNEAYLKNSSLRSHYRTILKIHSRTSKTDVEGESATDEGSAEIAGLEVDNDPQSPEEFYELLNALVSTGSKDPWNAEALGAIRRAVDTLDAWLEANPRETGLTDELPNFCAHLRGFSLVGGIEDFESDNAHIVHEQAWTGYLSSLGEDSIGEDHLLQTLKEAEKTSIRVRVGIDGLRERLVLLRKKLDDLRLLQDDDSISRQERREIEEDEVNAFGEREEARLRLRELEEELLNAALPPGIGADTWERLKLVDPEDCEADFPDAVILALKKTADFTATDTEPAITPDSQDADDGERSHEPEPLPEPEPVLPPESAPADEPAKNELQQACIDQLEGNGSIDSNLVNEAICRLVRHGRIEVAAQLAYIVENQGFSSDILPHSLLRGAYYGHNVWAPDRSLNKAMRILSTISPLMIEQWSEYRDGGRSVAFLVFAAALQPALFGGNRTNAGMLLDSISGSFDAPTQRLIGLVSDLSKHGSSATLKSLQERVKDNPDDEEKLKVGLHSWEKRIRDSSRGYAPIRKAQSFGLNKGEVFREILTILSNNSVAQLPKVESFLEAYSDRESCDDLLDELLERSSKESVRGDILSTGKKQFYHKVSDLVELAEYWVSREKQTETEVAEACRKISTLVPQAIQYFNSIIEDQGNSIDRQAGARIACTCLKNLRHVIDGNEKPIWPAGRSKAWYYYPQELLRSIGLANDPVGQLDWLLSQTEMPIDYETLMNRAITKGEVSLASLMYLMLNDVGRENPRISIELDKLFMRQKHDLDHDCDALIESIDSAVLARQIAADRSGAMLAEVETAKAEIKSLKQYQSVTHIKESIETQGNEVGREIGSNLEAMQTAYLDAIAVLEDRIGAEAVPQKWRETMETAIAEKSLLVVDEMLDEIQAAVTDGRSIYYEEFTAPPLLTDFLAVEKALSIEVIGTTDSKKLWTKIMSEEGLCGLDMSHKSPALKGALEQMATWRHSKPAIAIDDRYYNGVVQILSIVGFKITTQFKKIIKNTLNFKEGDGFVHIAVKVSDLNPSSPFAIFGEETFRSVIIAYRDFNASELIQFMASTRVSTAKPILISTHPMTLKQRNDLATKSERAEITVLHLDPVMAIFLESRSKNTANHKPIDNFLWATVPWTYFNPYTKGDTRMVPPPEMRFGREKEIQQLEDMVNGAAIVYGGRQLGKSTILHEVRERFHDPQRKKFAFYKLKDKDMDRTEITKDRCNFAGIELWCDIYDGLKSQNMIKTSVTAEPQMADYEKAIREALEANPEHKVIFIFDEIDPILNLDSAHDFGIFRGLRGLVYDFKGRFKIIIAGLENVKRFEDLPNNPLAQLGGPLQVSIMATRDAHQLIHTPIYAAGYTFENERVVNKILVDTNRHPGLLQIFCHELMLTMARNRSEEVGLRKVRMEDVRNVSENRDVMDLIKNRFDLTLHLDRRYMVIIYSLLIQREGSRPFSVKDAKESAAYWMPNEFGRLSNKQFQAYLDELCGLGVLKAIGGEKTQYQLRNANIRRLIGEDDDELILKITKAIDRIDRANPLERHAFFADPEGNILSPLSYRDEKGVFGLESPIEDLGSPVKPKDNAAYTVSIVVGSKAMGSEYLGKSIERLYGAERSERMGMKKAAAYESYEQDDTKFDTPAQFAKRLDDFVVKTALKMPVAVVINVTGDMPISHLTSMLDAAHEMHGKNAGLHASFPVRVIFVLSPKAYWQWLTHPEITEGREHAQSFINLSTWDFEAISNLLDKLQLNNSHDEVEKVFEDSQGWYTYLNILSVKQRNGSSAEYTRQFSEDFEPIDKTKAGVAKKFLSGTGVEDLEWVIPLIKAHCDEFYEGQITSTETIDDEFVGLARDKVDGLAGSDVSTIVRWMSDLSILRRVRQEDQDEGGLKTAHYLIDKAVAHAIQECYAE